MKKTAGIILGFLILISLLIGWGVVVETNGGFLTFIFVSITVFKALVKKEKTP